MKDEIKQILEQMESIAITGKNKNGIKVDGYGLQQNELKILLDYITNLQQAIKDTKDTADDMLYELKQENERLNNCIDDQERVINSLIDRRDLYKIGYNDYKYRCEKAINDINSYLDARKIINDNTKYYYTNEFYKKPIKSNINYLFNDYLEYLISILQNRSDNE